jgi:hypothetical protein
METSAISSSAQGIPSLPDLTHPEELIRFGTQVVENSLLVVFLIIGLGVAIALISFSLRRETEMQADFLRDWSVRYSQILRGIPHFALVLILSVTGFFLTSTLSNRYHHWEQAKVAKVTESVAGDKLEHNAPRISYITEEPYSYTTRVRDRIVKVTDKQKVTRYLNLTGSQIQVTIDQSVDVQNRSAIYLTDYTSEYKIVNTLNNKNQFIFEAPPPYGYSLLSGYKVEREGTRLEQTNPEDYGFPLDLAPGEQATIKVSYQAQGGPRWVYNATNQLLSGFRLTAIARFPNADFASGIVPQEIKRDGGNSQFTWIFDDNVSVKNPFGVFTSTQPIGKTGIIPRLLLLAPGLFLWWILLLYLTVPMSLQNLAIAGGVFFTSLLTLTYTSRFISGEFAWLIISLLFLSLIYGLGGNRQLGLAAIICTIAGAVLPIFAFLVPFTGLTLSLAGLLSVLWLGTYYWYDLYRKFNNHTNRST